MGNTEYLIHSDPAESYGARQNNYIDNNGMVEEIKYFCWLYVLTTYNKVLGKKGNIISIFMVERRFQAFLEMLILVKHSYTTLMFPY
jgi:hypothetical protein